MEAIRKIAPHESVRLTEIGELTALAYLSDGLVDHANPLLLQLQDARQRAERGDLFLMASGESADGAALGTVTLYLPGVAAPGALHPEEFEICMLAVSPLARGRGVGAALTLKAMETAAEAGADRVVLSTMEDMHIAHRLYERLGFTRAPELDEEGAPHHARGRLLGYQWLVS